MSIFADHGPRLIDAGISVLPIRPGTKVPGDYSRSRWGNLPAWTQFSNRLPEEGELEFWSRWPNAGIGAICGKISNIIGIDIDSDDLVEPILSALPATTVQKRGAKGRTLFYQYSGEKSRNWRRDGKPVLDLLSDGRQTVLPPTPHPDGMEYVWLTDDTLANTPTKDLPRLPDNYERMIDAALGIQAAPVVEPVEQAAAGDPGMLNSVWRELNDLALAHLDEWVPELLPDAQRNPAGGWRAIAHWRDCQNPNVGIHSDGIRDFGGDIGLTAIDLVMAARDTDFSSAQDWLRERLAQHLPDAPVLVTAIAVKNTAPAVTEPEKTGPNPPEHLLHPPGHLGEMVDWINATAIKPQPVLAVQAALATIAAVAQRKYCTQYGTSPALFLVSVAKSGSGKEHPKRAIEELLSAADLDHLIAGSGYTSPGAVMSCLEDRPSHITMIDEFGRYLSSINSQGNTQRLDSMTTIMESWGRTAGMLKPTMYSTTSLAQGIRGEINKRVIMCPAISIFGLTTSENFYKALDSRSVVDGFISRMLIVESNIGHQPSNWDLVRSEPPEGAINWLQMIARSWTHDEKLAGVGTPHDIRPVMKMVPCSQGALMALQEFEREILDMQTLNEDSGFDLLLNRSLDMATRISLLIALAMVSSEGEVESVQISKESADWAIDYVRFWHWHTISQARERISDSETDRQLKRIRLCIKEAKKYRSDGRYSEALAEGLMPRAKLLCLSRMKKDEFDRYVTTLVASDEVEEVMWRRSGSQKKTTCFRLKTDKSENVTVVPLFPA